MTLGKDICTPQSIQFNNYLGIQLYLDLYNYPIRGLEQAEHLYERRLKKLIEG
jgi:hypothetical protein